MAVSSAAYRTVFHAGSTRIRGVRRVPGERQDRIEAVQGLNGGLFIDAEHGRMLRRIQVQADDVGGFAFEVRIVAGHVALQAMRLQSSFFPDAMHGVFTDAQRCRQLAATPVCGSIAGFFARSGQNPGPQGRCQHAGLLAGMIGIQSVESGIGSAASSE